MPLPVAAAQQVGTWRQFFKRGPGANSTPKLQFAPTYATEGGFLEEGQAPTSCLGANFAPRRQSRTRQGVNFDPRRQLFP
jgi:hypothetical protein